MRGKKRESNRKVPYSLDNYQAIPRTKKGNLLALQCEKKWKNRNGIEMRIE